MGYQASLIFKDEVAPKGGSKITFGIHSNCNVTSIERGDKFVDINFSDPEGRTHNKRLWDANGNYPKIKDGITETQQEAIQREELNNLTHIVKVLHIFIGQEGLEAFPELDYDKFVKQAIKVVTPKLTTKKVNLKLIYDADGIYPVFGNFPDYIEEYVEGNEPTLKFSKWELENRCTYKGGVTKSDTPAKSLEDLY